MSLTNAVYNLEVLDKCPFCVEEGLKSILYPNGSSETLMGWKSYYDEEGLYHSHNPNITTTNYSCSNGHNYNIEIKYGCYNCGTITNSKIIDLKIKSK